MMAAPAPIPAKPLGANGCQFSAFTKWVLTRQKKARTVSLSTTMNPLKRADSFTPHTSTTVMAATMKMARALNTTGTPSTWGALCISPATLPADR